MYRWHGKEKWGGKGKMREREEEQVGGGQMGEGCGGEGGKRIGGAG